LVNDCWAALRLPLFEIARVLGRLAYVSRIIVNANYSIARAAEKLCVAGGVAGCVWLAIPQPAEWQRVGNQINAAIIFARPDFVKLRCGL
jgi:hypothetical protein